MTMFNKILVAIDFSKYSNLVSENAMMLAKELKAELIFVNVLNQEQVTLIQQTMDKLNLDKERFSMEDYIEEMIDERKADMQSLIKQMNLHEIPYSFKIYKGVPYKELLAAISEHKVNLVVMGVKGKSDLKDVIVGSTAIKMFRRCPVPLVSIREPEK